MRSPEQATAVHGITTEQARRDGRPIEEVLHELAGSIVEHWLRGYPVVAFNATYDITLVNQELRRHRLGSFEERLEGAPMLASTRWCWIVSSTASARARRH